MRHIYQSLAFSSKARIGIILLTLLGLSIPAAFSQAIFTYTGGAHSWTDASAWQKTGDATAATFPGDTGSGSQVHRVIMVPGIVTITTDITDRVNSVALHGGHITIGAGASLATNGGVTATLPSAISMGGASSLQVSGGIQIDTLMQGGASASSVFLTGDLNVPQLIQANAAGEISFNGSGIQTIANSNSFANLLISNTTGSVVATGSITVASHTYLTSATSELQLGASGGHALGIVSGAGTLSISAANGGLADWPQGSFTSFLNQGRVRYYGDNISYSISAVPLTGYWALEFTGLGRRTLTRSAAVRSNLVVMQDDTLELAGTTTLTMLGNVQVNGALRGGNSSTLYMDADNMPQAITGTGSTILNDLFLSKSGQATTLGTAMRLEGNLIFNQNGNLVLGNNDLTLAAASEIIANVTLGPAAMVEQDGMAGSGDLIKEGTTADQFVNSEPGVPFIYPIGSGGHYAPAQFTVLDATIAGTASIAIKTIELAGGVDVLRRTWRIHTQGLSAITDVRPLFTFDGSEVNGTPNDVTRALGGTYFDVVGSFFSGLVGRQTFGVNAPGNTLLEETWGLSKAGALPRTYYSFASGPYDSPETWSTDPSGAVQIEMPPVGGPNNNDVAVILAGHTVTMATGGKALNGLIIHETGVLDVDTTSGSNFAAVSGQGTLRLSRMALPGGVYEDFVSLNGGTVEYYDVSGILPASQLTYCHLSLAGTGTKVIGASGSNRLYRLNGNLSISGDTAILGNAAQRVWLSIAGNMTVDTGATLLTGTPTAQHNIDIAGNFVNNGTVKLTARTAPFVSAYASASPTGGYARVRFLGSSNKVATCNGLTNFYSIEVQKGVDPTYSLTISASDTANFNLLGTINGGDSSNANTINTRSRQALATRYGTLVLGSKIKIAALTTSQWRVNAGAGLVIDGARVNLLLSPGGGGDAFLMYGRFTIKAGSLNCRSSEGLVIRGAGEYIQTGGYVKAIRFRPSVITSTIPRSLFDMSGGQLDLLGATGQNYYGTFSHPYPNNVFRMSGGQINIFAATTSGTPANQAFHIGADPGNITVSGGTVNFFIPATNRGNGNDMGVSSTAPLYNVNVYSARRDTGNSSITVTLRNLNYGDENGTYAIPPRDLVILNNLALNGHAYLRSQTSAGFRVGGNVLFDTASRFEAGTSRFTLGNTPLMAASQTVTMRKPVTFNKLSINNSRTGGTVTLAGSSPTVTDTLSMDNGTLDDGGLTISASGNIINSATHTGAGRIKALGSATGLQHIGGNGSGQFGNLEFASTDSANRSFALSAAQRVAGFLTLTQGRLDLQNYNLHLLASAALIVNGSPGLTRSLTSNGVSTDGGFTRDFTSARSSLVLPFLHGGQIRTVALSVAATTYGKATVVPVIGRHPSLTIHPASPSDALGFYWRVNSQGFAGLSSAQLQFLYANVDCPPNGTAQDDSNYVAGRYNSGNWSTAAYTTQDQNVLTYSDITNGFEGDYTAGRARAFGGIFTYESITSGVWATPGTWKRTQNGTVIQNPSTTAPTSNSPIIIHGGHTITVTAASGVLNVPSIRIDTLATLDLDTTIQAGNPHNFNVVYPGVPASGRLRISSTDTVSTFPKGDFANFLSAHGGTVNYYGHTKDFILPSRTGNDLPLTSYRHLMLEPNHQIITSPSINTQVYENLSVMNGDTGGFDFTQASVGDMTIGRDFTVAPNTALFFQGSGTPRHIAISGDFVNHGYAGILGFSGLTHNLSVAGNIVNTGSIWFNIANDQVITTMTGPGNAQISGNGYRTRFGQLVINKGTDNSSVVEILADSFSLGGNPAGASKPLLLQNGTCKLSANRKLTLSAGNSTDLFQIPATAGLWIAAGRAEFTGTSANSGIQLDGTLKISGTGVVKLDGRSATADNSIQYASGGTPSIDMSGDSLLVGGQIRGNARAASGSLVYRQTRGETVVGFRNAITNIKPVFEVVNQGNFIQTGGHITLSRSRGNNSVADLLLQPATYTVSGGGIVLGQAGVTPAGATFSINATAPIYDLTVAGGANPSRASIFTNALQVLGTATLDTGATLLANNNDLRLAGDFVNNGAYMPGVNATVFNGVSGDQTVSGISSASFYDLRVANTALNGALNVTGSNWTINHNLDIASGTLATGSQDITVLGQVSNSSKHTSTTGHLILSGSQQQAIAGSGTGIFGSLRIDNASSVVAQAGFTVNGNLDLVNGLLDIQAQPLTLGLAGTITGSFSSSRMIRTSGASDDGGVTRRLPAAPFSFDLPIGAENHYTPAHYSLAANAQAGSITVRPVNRAHPLSTDQTIALQYYWSVNSTGFGNTPVNQVYTYDQASATGHGNEADYIGTHLTIAPDWELFPNTVDDAANTITFNLPAQGEFTAGEAVVFAPITPFLSHQSGPWNDTLTWENHVVPTLGSVVKIRAGHTVTMAEDRVQIGRLKLDSAGKLDIGTHIGTRLGDVTGTGTLTVGTGTLPSAAYNFFTAPDGGTIEFTGTGHALPASRTVYNNVMINSSGTLNNANAFITLNGTLTVAAGTFANLSNRKVVVGRDFINNGTYIAGTAASTENLELAGNFVNNGAFTSGSTRVLFNGDGDQRIKGSNSAHFDGLQITKATGTLAVSRAAIIDNLLLLDQGLIRLDTADLVLAANAQVKPEVVTENSYVWATEAGNLVRKIETVPMPVSSAYTLLPVGDDTRFLPFTFRLKQGDVGSDAQVAVNMKMQPHPQRGPAARYLKHYWTLSPTSINGTVDYDVRYRIHSTDDIQVDSANDPRPIVPYKFDGNGWTFGGTYDSTQLLFAWNDLDSFSDFTGGTALVVADKPLVASATLRVLVIPNPGQAGLQRLRLSGLASGHARFTLLDSKGAVLYRNQQAHAAGDDIVLKGMQNLGPGLYQIVAEQSGKQAICRFVVE